MSDASPDPEDQPPVDGGVADEGETHPDQSVAPVEGSPT